MKPTIFASLALVAAFVTPACVVGEDTEDAVAGEGLGLDQEANDPLAARVCASGATTKGIDVSYYQGNINWDQVKAGGVDYAFIRVSDGTRFKDPKFERNWAGTKAAGVIRGAYQFFRPAQSATAQADIMIAALADFQPGDLPPVIDVEATGGVSAANIAARIKIWTDRVEAAVGVKPIVYTGKYFWRDQVRGSTAFATSALWIAQYTTKCPDLPAPWTDWTFWQYTDKGRVPGITGNVDTNRFNGTLADLQAFANSP